MNEEELRDQQLFSSCKTMVNRDRDSPLTPLQTPENVSSRIPRIPLETHVPLSPFGLTKTSIHDLAALFETFPLEIYDTISFSPERNKQEFCTFENNILISATIPRLIVQLTSHDILDYNFMSDFFLSYRNFMTSDDVLECLLSRLTWAMYFSRKIVFSKADRAKYTSETGRDVARRVFVVLRHWILNFFGDDFVISFKLRSNFSSCINKLYNWPLVQQDLHFKRILDQLKKAWVTSCRMYWQIGESPVIEDFDVSLPIFPGGTFGHVNTSVKRTASREIVQIAPTASHCQRRFTLLSFYKGPIQPVISSKDLKDFKDSKGLIPGQDSNGESSSSLRGGFLINGGISLDSDVEVKSIKPPTPVRSLEEIRVVKDNIGSSPRSKLLVASTRKTLNMMIDSWKEVGGNKSKSKGGKLLAKFCNMMSISKLKESDQRKSLSLQQSFTDEIRIDILSARVIEELDLFLKMRFSENNRTSAQVPKTPPRESLRESPEVRTSISCESPTKKQRLDRRSGFLVESADIQLYGDSTYYGILGDRLSRYSQPDTLQYTRSIANTSVRTSMIDCFDFQNKLVNPSSTSLLSSEAPESIESDYSRNDKPSSRSNSFRSYSSYDSSYTINKDIQPLSECNAAPKIRRWANHTNLREIANISRPPTELCESTISKDIDTEDSIQDTINKLDISGTSKKILRNGSSGIMALEYAGMAADVAAQLAAIPDDIPDEDAVMAALLKLEGKYVRSDRKHEVDSLVDYSELQFESSNETDIESINHFELEPTCDNVQCLSDSETDSLSDANSIASLEVQNTSTYNSNLFRRAFESKFDVSSPPAVGVEFNNMIPDIPTRKPTLANRDSLPRKSLPRTIRSAENPLSVVSAVHHGNHTPFILNFSSKTLCAQFILIERDALMEVDWKQLIEMKWSRKVVPIQSWLEFLVERDASGVELVISRFNLMVNWIKSELLLTRQLDERVQTMSRFIHIGHHALKLQNYATVMQISLALQSPIVAKLKNTWKNIPENDGKLFLAMCELTSPSRNFGTLRAALLDLDPKGGCIPFLGMYLSDLAFNFERPTFVDGDVNGNKKVNVEKFETSSSIVKSLLQCIEWSTNYKLKEDLDLLAKCLYIQSLTIEEMDKCFQYLIDP